MLEPEIIIGSPGTGKTEALLGIVDELISSGVPPEEIGLVSFTKRAAREAVERASVRFGLDQKRFTHFRTLHSACFRALGISPGDILQGKALREFAEWIGTPLSAWQTLEEGQFLGHGQGDRILFMENLARVTVRPLRDLYCEEDDDLPWDEVERVVEGLRVYKKHRHLVDYTDLLEMFSESQMQTGIRYLLVDEAQDLSLLQWRVVSRLAQSARRVVVAGDDDQSIFAWAGAAVEYFVKMPGQVRVLGQSWRVPKAVQQVAMDQITQVSTRRNKQWSPRAETGEVDRLGSLEYADFTGRDVLVLARNSYILQDQVVPILRKEGTIYEYRGESSVDPAIYGAISTWERLRRGEQVRADEARAALRWVAGARKVTAPDEAEVSATSLGLAAPLSIWHEAMDRLPPEEMSYLLAARASGEHLNRRPRVRLSTIHSAKGAQADHVILLTELAPRTAREAEVRPDDEARVWYVGATRARQRLTIVASGTQYERGI